MIKYKNDKMRYRVSLNKHRLSIQFKYCSQCLSRETPLKKYSIKVKNMKLKTSHCKSQKLGIGCEKHIQHNHSKISLELNW